MNNNKIFNQVAKQKIIYIFRINDEAHKGLLKVGDTSNESVDFDIDDINTDELNNSASERINKYTRTAGIEYELLYTTVAINTKNEAFRDYDVHRVLENSGIQKVKIAGANEWYKTDLNTAINAINAVKNNRASLVGTEITSNKSPIVFRDEQKQAIDLAKERFKKKDIESVLWNAKMRFGKTLSGLQVIKELKYKKSIIITHRPVVDEGWFEDFHKIFYDSNNYQYGSKRKGMNLKPLINDLENNGISFVYFASIQDLRGSEKVGGKFDKNNEVFSIDWDLVIVDEAHEGTTTKLGENVIEALRKENTKFLYLSGTPFNIQDKFNEDDVYTWDYVMEQQAKDAWDKIHPLESNPYADLPRLNIYTYDLNEDIKNYFDISDKAFNFKEFFRVYTGNIEEDRCNIPTGCKVGDFIHEKDVCRFLDLMTKSDKDSNYPFSNPYYRDNFNHSLWIIPGVKEAKALSKLLNEHSIFGRFKIVNVAGDGDEDEKNENALDKVKDAIRNNPYTITLSCGKLTTGTTIKEWSAVMYLAGSYMTSAASYLQTIFRVQTPCKGNGKVKTDCYVFDFAPDRVLRILAEAVSMSKRQSNDNEKRIVLQYLINFLPVISMKGSSTKEYNVDGLLQELKKAYADRVARNGFDDNKLYNDELLKLNDLDIEKFNNLREIIGKQTGEKPKNRITINNQGLDNAELDTIEEISKNKKKRKLTPEELEKLNKYIEAKKQKDTAISILRGISVRIPLLIYGMDRDFDEDINIDNFTSLVDDESFEEFMPKGVTKDLFNEFKKYYDKDVFVAAGKLIRQKLKRCDDLPVIDRILEIAEIFNTFRNPDKETVLTPWKTVNMHISNTLGGYDFNQGESKDNEFIPRFVDNGDVTRETVCNTKSKVLEINSKTGLYPLYIAYSIFRSRLKELNQKDINKNELDDLWFKTIEENIYVLCKTQMAKTITLRTLCGYNVIKRGNTYEIMGGKYKSNIHYFKDYINQVKNKQDKIVSKILSGSYWGKEEESMKFDAVVGNPPYQESNHFQVYPFFYLLARHLAKYVSLIFPTGWQEPKNGNNLQYLNNEDVKQDSRIIRIDNRQNVFPEVPAVEWINIIFWNEKYDNGLNGKQNVYTEGKSCRIIQLPIHKSQIEKPKEIVEMGKVVSENHSFISMQTQISSRKPFGLDTEVFKKYPSDFKSKKINDKYLTVYGAHNEIRFVKNDFHLLTNSGIWNNYKVFVPYAWGNMDEKKYLGGAFADVIIGKPYEIVNETYLLAGNFKSLKYAKYLAKFLMTKFLRALLYLNKTTRHSTTAWGAVPIQDFNENWWEGSIIEINEQLFEKYKIPQYIKDYVDKNLQNKDESNIINY